METVDDRGMRGLAKRLIYRWKLSRMRGVTQGTLAIGRNTGKWLAGLGEPTCRIYEFSYFLPTIGELPGGDGLDGDSAFRIGFVGQLIKRKNLTLLLESLAKLGDDGVELSVVGVGPMEESLRSEARRLLGERVRWIGRLPQKAVPGFLRSVDVLVLPSLYDGWGAVVSEALLVGTPAICSDRCGSSGVVAASGYGGVFPSGDASALGIALRRVVASGKLTLDARADLRDWATCLGGDAGAQYLLAILDHADGDAARPAPPWSTELFG
ncbi:glycosyltransferase [Desertimonas flava]|uniref:glycosyltransferase n=1 Tax=Desertimonas flava TaxID=2064846 RepID=UPI0013C3F9B5|nr:glycosyltransferase [Desertimonas flava]